MRGFFKKDIYFSLMQMRMDEEWLEAQAVPTFLLYQPQKGPFPS
jgi:hypothetical protein